jgi:hypothetical protein
VVNNTLLRFCTVAILVLIVVSGIFRMNSFLISNTDFTMFYTGVKIIRSEFRSQLYDVNVQSFFREEKLGLGAGITGAFRNPPTFLLPFIPLSIFPLETAYRIFVLINITLLIISAKLLQNLFPVDRKNSLSFLIFSFSPGLITILTGQTSIMLLILFLVIFRTLKNEPFWAGMVGSLLINKPQYVVFIPFVVILAQNRKLFLKGLVVGMLGLLATSIVLVGPQALIKYPNFVLNIEVSEYESCPNRCVALSSFFYSVGLPSNYIYVIEFVLLMIVVLFFFRKYKLVRYEKAFSSALLFTIIFSPHVWIYDLFVLLIPIAILLKDFVEKKSLTSFGVLLLLFGVPFLQSTEYPYLVSFVLMAVAIWLITDLEKSDMLSHTTS